MGGQPKPRTARCRFCGAQLRQGTLAKHYRRSHWQAYQDWKRAKREAEAWERVKVERVRESLKQDG